MNLKIVNVFGTLSADELSMIFTNLDIVDIPKLCRINNNFNKICGKEHLWKDMVVLRYEVSCPLDGKTWRDTAKIFGLCQLIDKVLIYGKTLKETILEYIMMHNHHIDAQFIYSSRREYIYKSIRLGNYENVIFEDTLRDYSDCQWMMTNSESYRYYRNKLDREIILSIFQG